jgi:hypothetical protein
LSAPFRRLALPQRKRKARVSLPEARAFDFFTQTTDPRAACGFYPNQSRIRGQLAAQLIEKPLNDTSHHPR